MAQAVEIAQKLKLTSIALGCLTRKELCSAFARVNPNTLMTLQNSYNWQSGRSVPRSFSIFEDWAGALGIENGPHFVMSSSLSEFVRVLGEKFSLPAELLKTFGYEGPAAPSSSAPAAPFAAGPSSDDADNIWTGARLLQGNFFAISPSWSPSQHGQLVGGPLTIDFVNDALIASYQETVLGQTVPFSGIGTTDGRTCQLSLQCAADGRNFLMAFHLPPLPGNIAGGIFAGSAIYDPNSEPTASSIVPVAQPRPLPGRTGGAVAIPGPGTGDDGTDAGTTRVRQRSGSAGGAGNPASDSGRRLQIDRDGPT